ncbi:hypothetical protein [Lunatimonas salinarum]|uniref:hypothetical protein n=1 Tax=Lunatimonas salinarum TaxID=1774590 RepID=UPI001AE05C04|nr:hypothetical protein [Lunatimonas salinarum]
MKLCAGKLNGIPLLKANPHGGQLAYWKQPYGALRMNEDKKQQLLDDLQRCDNPYLLSQVAHLIDRVKALQPLTDLMEKYPFLLEKGDEADLTLHLHLQPSVNSALAAYEHFAKPIRTILAFALLVVAASIVNVLSHEGENVSRILFQSTMAKLYGWGWGIFAAEFLAVLWLRKGEKIANSVYWGLVVPPLHFASPHMLDPELMWLPGFGWCRRNEGLFRLLRSKFSIPMIVIAMLIIPVLLIEWKYYEEVQRLLQADLTLLLDLTQALIWLAFAFEFILMAGISKDRISYAKEHWVDLLIVLLPFIAFVRTMRIIKVARLSQVARGYKLRGLLLKARQGALFAGLLFKALSLRPEFGLRGIQKKLHKNRQQRERLEEELLQYARILDKVEGKSRRPTKT